VAATCPLGDHRSTEHRVLFRPTGIGLRSGTRSLALFVGPVSLPRARRHSFSSSLVFPEFFLFFFLSRYGRGGGGGGGCIAAGLVNIHVCMHVAVCTAMLYISVARCRWNVRKKNDRDTQLAGFWGKFISRFFHRTEMRRAAPTNCGESPRNASERPRDTLRILKIGERANGKRVPSIKPEFLYWIKSSFSRFMVIFLTVLKKREKHHERGNSFVQEEIHSRLLFSKFSCFDTQLEVFIKLNQH